MYLTSTFGLFHPFAPLFCKCFVGGQVSISLLHFFGNRYLLYFVGLTWGMIFWLYIFLEIKIAFMSVLLEKYWIWLISHGIIMLMLLFQFSVNRESYDGGRHSSWYRLTYFYGFCCLDVWVVLAMYTSMNCKHFFFSHQL